MSVVYQRKRKGEAAFRTVDPATLPRVRKGDVPKWLKIVPPKTLAERLPPPGTPLDQLTPDQVAALKEEEVRRKQVVGGCIGCPPPKWVAMAKKEKTARTDLSGSSR